MKYDKKKWIIDKIELKMMDVNSSYFLKGIEYFNNAIHGIITSTNKSTLEAKYYYLKGNINNWTICDSINLDFRNPQMRWGYYKLYTNNDLYLYSVGLLGCWKMTNDKWEKILQYNGELYDITGMSNNYLITCSAFKTLKYFDGSSWQDFSHVLKVTDPQFVFNNVWSNGFETIVVGQSNDSKLIVWRGR
ncbi:MAG: hypothetical protein AB1394_13155 [Bacteroidota bacterium]